MKVNKIIVYSYKLKNKKKFKANYGEFNERDLLLIKLVTDEGSGWGPCPTLGPYYSEETISSSLHIIQNIIAERVFNSQINNINDYIKLVKDIRGNNFAKASIELALWDILSKINKKPLHQFIGGVKNEINCGYSIGMINEKIDTLISKIHNVIDKGYRRIKLKITHNWDVEIIKSIRKSFPDINLMVDCNGGYTLNDIDVFKKLDDYNLDMIEQPLFYNDLYKHSLLKKEISTPICLDESIKTIEDIETAIDLDSCDFVNIKPFRVGGIFNSIKINNLCKENNITVWNGGMHESGIGVAFNLALASLDNFDYPADIVSPKDYFEDDIIFPDIEISNEGKIKLTSDPGIGYKVNESKLNKYTYEKITLERNEF